MRTSTLCLSLAVAASLCLPARADFSFDTQSVADQTLSSPAFGTVMIHSTGIQHFTINTSTGFANVTSPFHGTDFPDLASPGGFASYDLYNTATTGTVTQNPSGSYDVKFVLLFELKVTSGAFTGLTFETHDLATFENKDISGFPFPPATIFKDTSLNPDTVAIFVKSDPTGSFTPGQLVGTSSNRVVNVLSPVPEPSSLLLLGAGGLGLIVFRTRGRSR